ncbi:MAG: PH domain-containing protein [Deltaproteobacteria bacterium]|nr:PH domain-containing protein [Deltaproteobacteria bacterium]
MLNPFTARLGGYLGLGLALALALPPWFLPQNTGRLAEPEGVVYALPAGDQAAWPPECRTGELPSLAPDHLEGFPMTVRALAAAGRRPGVDGGTSLPGGEAEGLAIYFGRPNQGQFCFRQGEGVYLLRFAPAEAPASAGVDWRLLRTVAGGIFLLLGFWFMSRGYGRARGLAVNPRAAVMVGDAVFAVALAVGISGPLDWVGENLLGQKPLWDEALQFTLSVMYLPCLFFMAWFAANLSGQSLEATAQGVTWHGPLGSQFLPWDQIMGLELRDSHVMVSRVGLLTARRLQTRLVFRLAGDREVALFEPGTKRRKRLILEALGAYAPPRLARDLHAVAQGW